MLRIIDDEGNLYASELISYEITIDENFVKLDLETNKGLVGYKVTGRIQSGSNFEDIRDEISDTLESHSPTIMEYQQRIKTTIGDVEYAGERYTEIYYEKDPYEGVEF